MLHRFRCAECDEDKVHESKVSTGYGVRGDGSKVCYACCADLDRASMIREGHSEGLPLYLGKDEDGKWYVSNWPGTLRFTPHYVRQGRHNLAGSRTDVWFAGPDGFIWHGYQIGEFTQIVHCKRTKERVRPCPD